MPVALAIDSTHEPLTALGFQYRESNVYPYLQLRGVSVRKLQGPMAVRLYVAQEAVRPEVGYLTGVGHGQTDVYSGYNYAPIFQTGAYLPQEVAGKIVHFLSCQTAYNLGRDFVVRGCRAYFGYDADFGFNPQAPDIFFECDAAIDKGFADGLTAAAVYNAVRNLYLHYIASLRATGDGGSWYAASILEYNLAHLRSPNDGPAWGDPTAQLI
jgi:hypothetical protein